MIPTSLQRAFQASLLALGLASCAAGVPLQASRPGDSAGYPPQATQGPVHVEARYYLDQIAIFGGDMTFDLSLVPVALRMGVVGGGIDSTEIPAAPEDMDLVLILPDGTFLRRVPPEKLDVRRRRFARLVQEALVGGFLPSWTTPREGFVYFELPAGVSLDPDSLSVRRSVHGTRRSMDFLDSIVSFTVPIDDERREINVGLQPARRSPSRLSEKRAGLQ